MITVNGNKVDWFDKMTVRDILDKMGYDFALIVVTVNDVFIQPDDYSITNIPDNADVKVIHIFHGG